jgi:hypothetical protein
VKAAQDAWFEASPDLDPGRLVFPDEPAAATSIGLVEERPLLRAAFSEAVIGLVQHRSSPQARRNDWVGWIFAVPLSDATMEKADAR